MARSLYLILSCCLLSIALVDCLPQNPIVEGLRALFSTKKEGGVNLSLFEDLNIPLDLIPDEFKFIKKGLCGEESTKKCFCEEGAEVSSILFPRNRDSVTFKDIKRIFAKCRPTKCECSNGEEKVVTNFGCKNGGVPRCRINGQVSNDGPFGMMDPLYCQAPLKQLSEWDFIVARTEDKPQCICKNGVFPSCMQDSVVKPLCPDGDRADRSLAKLPPFFDECIHAQ